MSDPQRTHHEPLHKPPPAPGPSPMPSPNDHVRTIVELLRASGTDLGRRWLAALLVVPDAERAAVVAAVEKRIAATYADAPGTQGEPEKTNEVVVRLPPRQRDGYVEEITKRYEVKPVRDQSARARPKRRTGTED
jgi:hypothetical protein